MSIRDDGADGAIAELITIQSDRELAAEYRARLTTILDQVAALINEANANGLQIGFNIGRDQMGRNLITDISIFRPL